MPEKTSVMKQFLKMGVEKVEKVTSKCDLLVVGNGEPAKTSKLLMAVALGKPVVRDEWVIACVRAKGFVDQDPYLPKDAFDLDWKDTLGSDRKQLFKGKDLLITPALKKEYKGKMWEDIKVLAQAVGFSSTISSSARNAVKAEKADKETTVILGKQTEDLDLISFNNEGFTCYSKDLLSMSILKGHLDDKENFIIEPKQLSKQAAKRRKSAPGW